MKAFESEIDLILKNELEAAARSYAQKMNISFNDAYSIIKAAAVQAKTHRQRMDAAMRVRLQKKHEAYLSGLLRVPVTLLPRPESK